MTCKFKSNELNKRLMDLYAKTERWILQNSGLRFKGALTKA